MTLAEANQAMCTLRIIKQLPHDGDASGAVVHQADAHIDKHHGDVRRRKLSHQAARFQHRTRIRVEQHGFGPQGDQPFQIELHLLHAGEGRQLGQFGKITQIQPVAVQVGGAEIVSPTHQFFHRRAWVERRNGIKQVAFRQENTPQRIA